VKRACRVRVSAKRARLTRCTSQTLLPSLVLLNISSRIGEDGIFLLTQNVLGRRAPPRRWFFLTLSSLIGEDGIFLLTQKILGRRAPPRRWFFLTLSSLIGEDGIFLLTQKILGRRALPRSRFFLTLVHSSGRMANRK
jgi:hypothetical protein